VVAVLLAVLFGLVGASAAGGSFATGANASSSVTSARIFSGTRSTTAFLVADASGGGTAVNVAEATAATDARLFTSGKFATAFAATRYVDFSLSGPLAGGLPVADAALELTFAASGGGTACVYAEVRRTNGAVLGTHGSATTPLACSSNTAQVLTATTLAELTSSTDADNLTIRLYGRSTTSRSIAVDRVAVTGTAYGPFTLTAISRVDASTGTAGADVSWSLAGADAAYLTSAANWPASFAASRSIAATFPAMVPAGAVVSAATLRHTYASASAGTTCYWFEVRGSTGLVGTHGSTTTPVSCNATTTMATDSISLTELTTGAAANDLTVILYVRQSSGRKSRHDAFVLDLTYSLS
jgi:hypothetical protein